MVIDLFNSHKIFVFIMNKAQVAWRVFEGRHFIPLASPRYDINSEDFIGKRKGISVTNIGTAAAFHTVTGIMLDPKGAVLVFKFANCPRWTEGGAHLIKGWSDKRIADELFVSYNTVRAHVRNIYSKTAVHNREELLDAISEAQQLPNP
jgi:hypothetical protein